MSNFNRQAKQNTKTDEHSSNRGSETENAAPEFMNNTFALDLLRHREAGSTGPLQRRAVQQLSSLVGNRNLQRILEGEEEAEGVSVADDAMPADLRAFLQRGVMPGPDGADITPTGIGGFNARFNPDSRELIITLNVGISFIHGLSIDPATNNVTPDGTGLDMSDTDEQGTFGELQAAANQIMTDVPAADRAAEVNSRWRWGGEEDAWMTQYQQTVQTAWGGQHFFISQDWPELMSNVRVAVNVHRGQADGDHTKGKIIKTPPNGIGAYVQSNDTANANDQELIMSSSDVDPSPNSLLRWELYFAHDSANIAAASSQPGGAGTPGPAFLNQFIATFNAAPGNAGQTIQLIGHASSVGSPQYNQHLSEQRAAAVEAFLQSNGLTGSIDRTQDSGEGETGAGNDAESRRVDLVVGSGEGQLVATHETGHLLGLDDEYATGNGSLITGSGNPIGSSVAHSDIDADALADAPIDGAVSENNDNIMSLGNTVRPQHYATFHAALEQVTSKSWRYGGEGDAPSVIPGTPVPGGVVT
ncbi:MAG: OmpA family protein [Anaerolineae bacterium]|nr:OmpA family protein [Anaerolineae bacterium]